MTSNGDDGDISFNDRMNVYFCVHNSSVFRDAFGVTCPFPAWEVELVAATGPDMGVDPTLCIFI